MIPMVARADEPVEGVELRHLDVLDGHERHAEAHLHHDRELGDDGRPPQPPACAGRSCQWAPSAHSPTAALVATTTHAKSAWSSRNVTG